MPLKQGESRDISRGIFYLQVYIKLAIYESNYEKTAVKWRTQTHQDLANYFGSLPSKKNIRKIIDESSKYAKNLQNKQQFLTDLKEKWINIAHSSLVVSDMTPSLNDKICQLSEYAKTNNLLLKRAFEIEKKDLKIELINQLNTLLANLQEQFPLGAEGSSVNARMAAFIHRLSVDVDGYLQKVLSSELSDEKAIDAYAEFKKIFDLHLNLDDDARELKRPDSIFYSIHYALMTVVRAFFRMFDLLITFATQAKHSLAETPNRHAFFNLPEKQLDKVAHAFTDEVSVKLNELDALNQTTSAVLSC